MLAGPRGFCAGVVRAIEIVERALERYGPPVYVRHEIVHNRHVVESLAARGAIFVDEVDEAPLGAICVFSAHGVSRKVERDASARGLDVIDATCPLVRKVHRQGQRFAADGDELVLVGHEGHAEVEGTLGQIDGKLHVVSSVADVERLEIADPSRVAFVTQTTLSLFDTRDIIAALRRRYPQIKGPDTRNICYATQNRQKAVLDLLPHVELLVVIGSQNSSNSNRLRELGDAAGVPAYLIDGPHLLDPDWIEGVSRMGLTAGASAPETLVQATLLRLADWRPILCEEPEGAIENVTFRLPERLAEPASLAF
jgi:4-hydroxy-3-methylbut-2-enyl diphosphate reductase